eukprot:1148179-Rhodomonas_salina.1
MFNQTPSPDSNRHRSPSDHAAASPQKSSPDEMSLSWSPNRSYGTAKRLARSASPPDECVTKLFTPNLGLLSEVEGESQDSGGASGDSWSPTHSPARSAPLRHLRLAASLPFPGQ